MKTETTVVDLHTTIADDLKKAELNMGLDSKTFTDIKVCSVCKIEKLLSDFHSKGERKDSSCKSCVSKKKKELRKKQASHAKIEEVVAEAQRCLQALSEPRGPQFQNIEPVNVSQSCEQSVCFDHWEDRYGRQLSNLERMEIKDNLNNFVSLLKSEVQGEGRE